MRSVDEENSPNNLLNVQMTILFGLFFITCPVTKYESNNDGWQVFEKLLYF